MPPNAPLRVMLPLIALGIIVAIDLTIWTHSLPRAVFGALDETAHLLTAALILSAIRPLRAYPRLPLIVCLVAAEFIDIDHVPSELFGSTALIGSMHRPIGHTLACVLAVLAISPLLPWPRARQLSRWVALGFCLHLVRDLATGGAPLLWPISPSTVAYPHGAYLILLVLTIVATAMRHIHHTAPSTAP